MRYCISKLFVLRENLQGDYILYNKETFYVYHISAKLYHLLSCFLTPTSFADFDQECLQYGIDNHDFYKFIHQTEFKDVLACALPGRQHYDYVRPNFATPFTYRTPERVDFVITRHCNLCCKHCFESSSPLVTMTAFAEPQITRVIGQLEASHIKSLKVTGGEPLTHPSAQLFLSQAGECHFETTLLTNGLLIDEACMATLRDGHIRLGISLDGATSQTHDYIRGKGSFDKLIPILKEIKRNRIYLSITCTLSKHNLSETGKVVGLVLDEIQADKLILSPLISMGRATEHTNIALTAEDALQIEDIYHKAAEAYGESLEWADATKDGQIEMIGNDISCIAGNSLIAIDEHFDVYPCLYGVGFHQYAMGNLLREDLADIWSSQRWLPFRGGTVLGDLPECRICGKNKACALKVCRLRPLFEGNGFYGKLSFCGKNHEKICPPIINH